MLLLIRYISLNIDLWEIKDLRMSFEPRRKNDIGGVFRGTSS